jgi:hypothetical protein
VEALQLPVMAVLSTSVVVVATCVTVVGSATVVVGALVTAAEVSAFVVTTGAVLVAASLVRVDADVVAGSESYTHPCVNRLCGSAPKSVSQTNPLRTRGLRRFGRRCGRLNALC